MKKIRIDQLLFQKGLAPSRERAQSLILAGLVSVKQQKVLKASETYLEDTEIEVKGKDHPYVSRGGVKLEAALLHFRVQPTDLICLDVGASTGGFTDCLLQHQAQTVYAVDVGFGQLHWKLRNDPRVVMLERTNFRYLNRNRIREPIDLAVADVSFISLEKILPKLQELLAPGKEAILLVKPQFELSPQEVPKGIVRSEASHQKAIQKVKTAAESLGFHIRAEMPSPLLGSSGNQEFLLHLGIDHKIV